MTTTPIEEPVSRIMTISKLRQLLEKFPSDVFANYQAGDYSTVIALDVSEEGDMEVNIS